MGASQSVPKAQHGDFVAIGLDGVDESVSVGDVLYVEASDSFELRPCARITALVAVSAAEGLRVGSLCGLLCVRSGQVECELSRVYWKRGAKDGKEVEGGDVVGDKEQAKVELVLKAPLVAAAFADCACLGRFVILNAGQCVCSGKIESV